MYEGTQIYADGTRYAISEVQTLTRTSTGGTITLAVDGQTTNPIAAKATATNKVQSLTIDATGGTFTITYSGQTTSALAFDATGATITTALDALNNLAPGDIVVTGSSTPYTVTYGGALAGSNVPTITTTATGLTGGASTAVVATTTIGGPAFNAANVQSALAALSTVGAGNVSVSGSGPLTVSFIGSLAGSDVPAIVVDNTNATGGTVTAATSSTTGPKSVTRSKVVRVYGTPGRVQTITRTSTGGTFTLTYDGQTTATITAVAGLTAAAIQSALRGLSNLADDEVAVTGSNGGPFTVTFSFDSNPDSVEVLVVDDTSATGGDVTVAQQVPVWNVSSSRLEWGNAS